MFTRILVPLDESSRAERALSTAARLARASRGSIVLLRAVGIPFEYNTYIYSSYISQAPVITQEVLNAEQAKAEAYLADIRQSTTLAGIQVETKVLIGNPATTIEDIADEEQIDLIVLCSHGDTGFKRWALGSVAQKVSRHSHVPVLVLHQRGTQPDSPFPDRLRPLRSIVAMVALDGSSFAEAAIEPTTEMVAALSAPFKGTVLLTMVVPPSANGSQQSEFDDASTYLNGTLQKYKAKAEQLKIALNISIAPGKDVPDTLIRSAEQGEDAEGKRPSGACDLLAITTHGRDGMQRLAMGSVTEHLLGVTKLPLLVVHNP